jgi:glycosyltransferase involved in cell wall biosynthesis
MAEFEEGLSVCMIVRNEEDYLRGCLESINGLADEIIIVDTGSTDKTIEIAREFTDKIFNFEWVDDFSKARNYSISKASKSWILVLDADERILKEDIPSIKSVISDKVSDGIYLEWRDYHNGYGIANLVNVENDRYSESKNFAKGYIPLDVVRLFRNSKNHFFEGRIHETVNHSIITSGGKFSKSNFAIHHLGSLDKDKNLTKKEQYSRLLEKRYLENDFSEKPEHRICFELYKELFDAGKKEESLFYLEKAVSLKELPEYLSNLGLLYYNLKRFEEAEKIFKKAILEDPSDYVVHFNLGSLYIDNKDYYKAIRKFEKVLKLNQSCAEAYFNLGLVYKYLGKKEKARLNFERSQNMNPLLKERVAKYS